MTAIESPEDLCELRATEDKGLGLFATRDIQAGEQVILDRQILGCRDYPDLAQRTFEAIREFDKLSKSDQDDYLSLYSWQEPTVVEELRQLLAGPTHGAIPLDQIEPSIRVVTILRSNGFQQYENRLGEDGEVAWGRRTVFPWASRFNHSCDPNLVWSTSWVPGYWQARANRDIEEGTELTISYVPAGLPHEERRKQLSRYWGFICACDLCERSDSAVDEETKDARQTLQEGYEQEGGTIAVQQGTSEEIITRYERRIQILDQPRSLSQLYFAYLDAADFCQHLAENNSKEELAHLEERVQLLEQAYATGVQVWGPGDQMVLDTAWHIKTLKQRLGKAGVSV
ncbi:hypothetical protein GGS23DRAFT_564089 [Durotheca rogersii]|uniref:uncharacterized protein n=1 Tax=Durotheca rogersii TaxID=419775 RepID=UPI00221FFEC8|nr:uncharacterized protein GGS23DRAFT_564089 [Durotheca rogersii]KAI5864379.1 hypothetical protein GGS23DRAFT_564089 [Durotheca rogersii]